MNYFYWRQLNQASLRELHALFELETESEMEFGSFCAFMFEETVHARGGES